MPFEGRALFSVIAHHEIARVRRRGVPSIVRTSSRRGARMSVGGITEEEVEGIRTGTTSEPSVKQVAALAAAFGVEPSYLVDREGAPPLDAELLEGPRDETTREITRQALRLPERERQIVLGIVRQFGEQR